VQVTGLHVLVELVVLVGVGNNTPLEGGRGEAQATPEAEGIVVIVVDEVDDADMLAALIGGRGVAVGVGRLLADGGADVLLVVDTHDGIVTGVLESQSQRTVGSVRCYRREGGRGGRMDEKKKRLIVFLGLTSGATE